MLFLLERELFVCYLFGLNLIVIVQSTGTKPIKCIVCIESEIIVRDIYIQWGK